MHVNRFIVGCCRSFAVIIYLFLCVLFIPNFRKSTNYICNCIWIHFEIAYLQMYLQNAIKTIDLRRHGETLKLLLIEDVFFIKLSIYLLSRTMKKYINNLNKNNNGKKT